MGRGLWMGFAAAAVAGFGVLAGSTGQVNAEGRTAREGKVEGLEHPSARAYRRGPQVRGYVQRRGGYYGGYSYRPEDSINTYGDARTKYGSASVYRDPALDRQTRFGPFDHGFFYDSGILSPFGGNSVYFH